MKPVITYQDVKKLGLSNFTNTDELINPVVRCNSHSL